LADIIAAFFACHSRTRCSTYYYALRLYPSLTTVIRPADLLAALASVDGRWWRCQSSSGRNQRRRITVNYVLREPTAAEAQSRMRWRFHKMGN